MSFAVGSPPVTGAVGDWVAANEQTLAVRFSDGSVLAVSSGARMRVTETSERGAIVLIEQGSIRANIAHRGADTEWKVRAGPFVVRVTGTELSASWDPGSETFDLVIHHGSVVVSGPVLPSGREVVAGERLVVSVRDGRMDLTTAQQAETTGEAHARTNDGAEAPAGEAPARCAEAAGESGVDPPSGEARAAAAPSASAGAPRAWRKLAADGEHREAMASLDAGQFAQLLRQAGATELCVLADAARFGGHPGRARQALLVARKRFGASGATTFLLGKIAADQLGSPKKAVHWFETYLAERPNGPLAEQALGRILELRRRGPAARKVAKRYLARFPNGAYATLARRVLSP